VKTRGEKAMKSDKGRKEEDERISKRKRGDVRDRG
jgi:hypothetical protein